MLIYPSFKWLTKIDVSSCDALIASFLFTSKLIILLFITKLTITTYQLLLFF